MRGLVARVSESVSVKVSERVGRKGECECKGE